MNAGFNILYNSLKIIIRFLLRLIISLILLLLLVANEIFAQSTDIFFERIFLEQGLSQSIVKSICQDNKGFLYFGTEDGLNIYNGYEFKILRNEPNDSNSLSYNDITALFNDHNGIIWIGSFNAGLNIYNPTNENFIHLLNNHDEPTSLSHNNINTITEDKTYNIWIGTDNGLCKFNNKTPTSKIIFERFLDSISITSLLADNNNNLWIGTKDGLYKSIRAELNAERNINHKFFRKFLPGEYIYSIYEDSDNEIWIGTTKGLIRIKNNTNDQKLNFIRYTRDVKSKNSLNNNIILAIAEDDSKNLWIGTMGGGINLLNKKDNKFTHYQNDPYNNRSISYNEIPVIFKDRAGILWIGTYGSGLNKVSRGAKQFFHYFHRPQDVNTISHSIVWAFFEDKDSILWIGTQNGLDKLNRKTNKFIHYKYDPSNKNGICDYMVRVLVNDKNDNLWIGTGVGGISVLNKKDGKFKTISTNSNLFEGTKGNISSNEIRDIFEDSDGNIWIGTYGDGLNKYDPLNKTFEIYRNDPRNDESLSNDFIRIIYEDKNKNIWIGTEGGGLNKFDRDKKVFKSFKTNQRKNNWLNNNYIFSIHEDKNKKLWLGTFGGGLNKFDPEKEIFENFTVSDGLLSNAVYGILEDENGYLWLSTNKGLSRFNLKTEKFKNYNVKDGLQNNEFNGGAYFKSSSGELFFGGINGFTSFYPDEIKDNTFMPPVIITSFKKFNKEVLFEKPIYDIDKIELSYKDYIFSFEFASMDFTAPEKNQYAYKMEGLDDDWIFVDADKRYAHYTTLPSGKYTFKLKASNSDGMWNESGTSIDIIIKPPFWKTIWFNIITSIFILMFGFVFYKRRSKNIMMKAEIKAAHDAQMSIMPQTDPIVKGLDISGICIPANEVGGDFYDYFWLNKDKTSFGILLGDVSGKGMKAAMTAVMTSGMIITETNSRNKICEVFYHVNKSIYHKTEKNIFITAIFVAIDMNLKEGLFINAGHLKPIVKSSNKVRLLNSDGPRFPLGMFKEVCYEENIFFINKSDLIILMTDGLIEVQNGEKELFGVERISEFISKIDIKCFSAAEIKEKILNEVKMFSGNKIHNDDMALIIIKVL